MENNEKLHSIRHSLAHILAIAVLEKDPEVKLGIGPVIDNGFYYDFLLSKPLKDEDLKDIEKSMKKIISQKLDFTGENITFEEVKKKFSDQPFKLELIEDLEKEKSVPSIYTTGNFVDLCRGGHIGNTKEINPEIFKLSSIAGAYWRGSEKNQMLTRIYGLAFETKKELEDYLKMMEEAEKRDHRKLGKELDLFCFSDVIGKGLPLWTEKGATIRRELERFIVDEEIRRGYKHVCTPDIAKLDLYKKSGHYPYYKDSMYAPIAIDEEEFMLRPMTCPHHFELYLNKPRSYKELPMRIAELAKLYRYEQSGELTGLVRVRSFCLADAHIVCANPDQAGEEVAKALDLIDYASKILGLEIGKDYSYRLSLGDRKDDKKYFKDDKAWDEAEDELRKVLKARKANFIEAEKEAAFYGPKIDIQMKDVRGKENTAFTVQYDFVMPKRFDLKYTDKDGKEKEAIVVHHSSIGAIERIIAFLIEKYAGAFPLWLSPVQVSVLPISEKQNDYAKKIYDQLFAEGIRVELNNENETLGKKIRESKKSKVPYIIVIGEKEVTENTITVESRKGSLGALKFEDFLSSLSKEIKDRANI